MGKELKSKSIPEMLKKRENEPMVKPLSCLGIFVILVLILYFTIPVMLIWFVNGFFDNLASMHADRTNEAIRRINAKMDDFEESLRPIREQIEALDHRVPKSETQIAPIETEQ